MYHLLDSHFFWTADIVVAVVSAAWLFCVTETVSSPNKSMFVTIDNGATFGTTFFASDLEFLGECGFGKGAEITDSWIVAVGFAAAVSSGNDDVLDVDFFLRFWFLNSSLIFLFQSTKKNDVNLIDSGSTLSVEKIQKCQKCRNFQKKLKKSSRYRKTSAHFCRIDQSFMLVHKL